MKLLRTTALLLLTLASVTFAQSDSRLAGLFSDDPALRLKTAKSLTDEETNVSPKDLPTLLSALEKSDVSETEFRKEVTDVIAQFPYVFILKVKEKVKTMDFRIALEEVPHSTKSRVFSVMSKITEDSEPRIKERAYFALSAFNPGVEKIEAYLVGRWKQETTERGKAAVLQAFGLSGLTLPESKTILTSAIAADREPLTTTALDTLIYLKEQDVLSKAEDFLPEVVPLLHSSNILVQSRAISFVENLGVSAKAHLALLKSTAATLPEGETKMLLEQAIKNLNK